MVIHSSEAGKIYKHFKGNYYTYIGDVYLADDTEQGTLMSVYQANRGRKIWVRPKSEFFGFITRVNDGYGVEQVSRFEEVKTRSK